MLVGIDATRLEQLQKLFAAAGLEVRGVTATGLALAGTFRRETGDTLVLFGGHGTELVRREAGRPVSIRHLNGVPATGDVAERLTGELARALSLGGGGGAGSVALVGGPDFSDADVAALSDRLGRDVHSATPLEALGELSAVASLNGEAAGVVSDRVWPAVALAGLGARGGALPVDFLDPKLAPPPPPRFDRKVIYGAMAGVLLVGGLAWLWTSAGGAEAEAARLEATVDADKADVEAAEKLIAEVQFGRGYYETRPPALGLMTGLAEAFPDAGGIWAGAMSMRADGKSQIQGKAADDKVVLSLRDELMGRPAFRDVQLIDLRQSTGKTPDTSYSLGFNYQPTNAVVVKKEGR